LSLAFARRFRGKQVNAVKRSGWLTFSAVVLITGEQAN